MLMLAVWYQTISTLSELHDEAHRQRMVCFRDGRALWPGLIKQIVRR